MLTELASMFDRKNRFNEKQTGGVRVTEKYRHEYTSNENLLFWNNCNKSTDLALNLGLLNNKIYVLALDSLAYLCLHCESAGGLNVQTSTSTEMQNITWIVFQSTLCQFLNKATYVHRQMLNELLIGKFSTLIRILIFYDDVIFDSSRLISIIPITMDNALTTKDGHEINFLNKILFLRQFVTSKLESQIKNIDHWSLLYLHTSEFISNIINNNEYVKYEIVLLPIEYLFIKTKTSIVSPLLDTNISPKSSNNKFSYPPHISQPHLSFPILTTDQAIDSTTKSDTDIHYYEGTLMVYKHSTLEAEVTITKALTANMIETVQTTVLIQGRLAMNRALDGDTVIVALYPEEKWVSTALNSIILINPTTTTSTTSTIADEAKEEAIESLIIPSDEDEFLPLTASTLTSTSTSTSNKYKSKMPTGYIVSVLQRRQLELLVYVPQPRNSVYSSIDRPDVKTDLPTSTISLSKEENILVTPVNKIFPKFRIRTRQKQIIQGKKLLIGFQEWPCNSYYPIGYLKKIIGYNDDKDTEVDILLMSCEITPQPFSIQALACLPAVPSSHIPSTTSIDINNNNINNNNNNDNILSSVLNNQSTHIEWKDSQWKIPSVELRNRRDLRCLDEYRIFSVDPPGCQGNYQFRI